MRKDIVGTSRNYVRRVQRFMASKAYLKFPKVKRGVK